MSSLVKRAIKARPQTVASLITLICLASLLGANSRVNAAEPSPSKIYVKAEQTSLREKPNAIAKKVFEAKRGAALDVVRKNESDERWMLVRVVGAKPAVEGWVHSLSTSPEPILANVSNQGAVASVSEAKSARARNRPKAAVMGVRGLRNNEKDPADAKYPADYPSLEKVEKYRVPASKAKAFKKELPRGQ